MKEVEIKHDASFFFFPYSAYFFCLSLLQNERWKKKHISKDFFITVPKVTVLVETILVFSKQVVLT